MFEVDDKNLGKAKVVNITEARQSMASIMTDQDFSYIITKNNQPIRVILSYEVLNRIQGAPKSASVAKEKIEVSRRSIQGLLKEREEDIQRHPPHKERVKKAVGEKTPAWVFEDAPKELPVIKKITKPVQVEVPQEEIKEEFVAEEMSPEVNEAAEYFDAEEAVEIEDQNKEFEGDFFEVSDDDALMPPPPSGSSMTMNVESHSEEIQEEPEPQKEEDYFSRFRKLYEGASKKLDTKAPAPVNKPVVKAKEVQVKPVEVKRPDPVYDAPMVPPPLPPEARPATKAAAVVPPPLPQAQVKVEKPTNEFPSIEELLEELEKEKLSGE